MKLYIDDKLAEMDERSEVSISVSIASIVEPERGRVGYIQGISIPMTPLNREIMGDCEQINARDIFNRKMHAGRIEYEGCVIMEGYLRLSESVRSEQQERYVFNIIGSGKQWVDHVMRNTFSSLLPDYSFVINGTNIERSWTASTPVRWLPVQRDKYEPENSSVGILPAERVLTPSDYHPFIHLRTAVYEMMDEAGYGVESEFLDSEYFDSFYMSGNYPERDVEIIKHRMDFCAGRFNEVSATADMYGIVYTTPGTLNTVGNIVDTADPKEEKDGQTADGVFDNGDCFQMYNMRVRYVPHYKITAGFEYKFRYVTEYKIKNTKQLSGFDRIFLGNGHMHQFEIANRFEDRKQEFTYGKSYRCVISDFESGYLYTVLAERSVNGGVYVPVILGQFSTRSAVISTSTAGEYTNLRVTKAKPNSSAVLYDGDWGLYDGYVAETGETEVEITIRSCEEVISPAAPKYFSSIYFAGAEKGMKFTLKDAKVRPVFNPHPGENSTVCFKDIGAHAIKRMDVLNALREMFGLCFYTDDVEKKVYIEPRESFYRTNLVVDVSDRIDVGKPLKVSDIASEVAGTFTWEYKDGDGATALYNIQNGGKFGRWTVETDNPWRKYEYKSYVNTLFTPSRNVTECTTSAKSASLVAVGDRSRAKDAYIDDLNFMPKVVRYLGVKSLPETEVWGWPSFKNEYPLLAFHYPEWVLGVAKPESPIGNTNNLIYYNLPFTLCYEDRDDVEGLHKWWDGLITAYESSIRLTAWMKLNPEDIEVLLRPNYLMRDFRAVFRLHIDGEWSDWRLEEVCDYSPSAPSTKCVFVKIP